MSEVIRKLASIQKVLAIVPIEGANNICSYKIQGWNIVDTIGKYAVGELVVLCVIDSWIPTTICPFLSKGKEPHVYQGIKGEKLRTIKLKNTVSQGLILPLSPTCDHIESELFEGVDVTFPLGIIKWEPVLPACLAGQAEGLFPSFGRKTDQERIESIEYEVFTENKDSRFEVTLKLDGSSCSVIFKDGALKVCSRNLSLKLNEENASNTFISTATKTGLITALEKLGRNLQVSGELLGNGIQGNRENLSEHQLFVFDIFDIDNARYMAPDERIQTFNELVKLGFTGKHVPIIAHNVTLEEIGITDVATSKVFVDRPSLNATIAEGCVFKRMDGQFSFKSINNNYLLKHQHS